MKNKKYAWLIGIGLITFAIHNKFLTPMNDAVEAIVFLPLLGLAITITATMLCLYQNRKTVTLGSKWVWIPLAVISLSIALSGIAGGNVMGMVVIGILMFAIYLAARVIGRDIFKPFMYIVILETLSLVVYKFIGYAGRTGGLASETNYDMAAGLLIFGLIVSAVEKRWWLSAIAIIGVFLTGAEEGLFALGVLLITVLIRRDISKKLLLPACTTIVLIIVAIVTPLGNNLYRLTIERIDLAQSVVTGHHFIEEFNSVLAIEHENPELLTDAEKLNAATGYRIGTHWNISPIKPFGYGYNMTEFYYGIPHNIPLIIVEQVGILGAIAWLIVSGYCVVKTKWRYAWIGVLALCVFDHYIWTQAGFWWWALVGVSTSSQLSRDYIFKGVNYVRQVVWKENPRAIPEEV